jgi:hypothetical protein
MPLSDLVPLLLSDMYFKPFVVALLLFLLWRMGVVEKKIGNGVFARKAEIDLRFTAVENRLSAIEGRIYGIAVPKV